jgi:PAS domain S-box-containing protein
LVRLEYISGSKSIKVSIDDSQTTIAKRIKDTNNFIVIAFLSKVFEELPSKIEFVIEIFESILDSLLSKVEGIFTLQEIIDLAPIGMIIATPDGVILKVNKACAQMFGYKKEEMVGKYFLNITAFGDIEKSVLKLREFLEKNLDSYSIRKKYIRKDGTEFEAIATVNAIKRGGKTVYGLVVIRSLEEQLKIERKIKDIESKFNVVFNNTDIPMVILGLEGLVYEANEKFLSLIGKEREEVIYHPFFNFVENSRSLQESFLNYIRSGNRSLEISGNIKTFSGLSLFDVAMLKFDGFVLVKLKQKGRKLEFKSIIESSLVSLAESVSKSYGEYVELKGIRKEKDFLNYYVKYLSSLLPFDIILLLNKEFTIRGIKLSESVFKMHFDNSLGDISYSSLPLFKIGILSSKLTLDDIEREALDKDISEIFSPTFSDVLKNFLLGVEYQDMKEIALNSGGGRGKKFFFEVRALKIENIYLLAIRDITSQKKYEEVILKEKELLLKEVLERRKFWAVISHEMRTPLNSIIGFSNLLFETPLDEKQKKYLNLIKFSSETLLSLINDVLEYSKLDESEANLVEMEFDLYEEFLNSISMLEQKAANKNIKIDYYFDFTLPSLVVGDVYKLRRVIMNLLDNAIKFSHENSNVIVSAELCSLTSDNKCLITFSVTDYGIGIPKDKLNDIFKPFVQVDMGLSRRYEGSGLGLSICKKIVDLMGGEIKAESEVNKGTRFTFTIPITIKDSEPLIIKLENYLSAVRNFLFVVDESLPTSYIDISQHLGVEVVVVANLGEVLELIEENRSRKLILLIDYCSIKWYGIDPLEGILKDNENVKIILFKVPQSTEVLNVDVSKFFVLEHPMNVFELFKVISKGFEWVAERGYTYEDVKNILDTSRRVLVVEDNHVNSLLMVEILKKFSISPDVAYSGKECLEMMKIKDYDLILMDVQMPDMDGYKLTTIIRSKNLERKPIIVGVSAHAYKEDIEEAIKSGMDDYITKPIRMDDIIRVLVKYLSKTSTEVEVKKEELTVSDEILDEVVMKKFLDLVGKDRFEPFVRDILDSYVKTFNSEYSKLVRYNLEKNVEEISKVAHKLKGASYEIGFMKLGNVFKNIEDKARKGENILTQELLSNIQSLFEKSFAMIEKYISTRVSEK